MDYHRESQRGQATHSCSHILWLSQNWTPVSLKPTQGTPHSTSGCPTLEAVETILSRLSVAHTCSGIMRHLEVSSGHIRGKPTVPYLQGTPCSLSVH